MRIIIEIIEREDYHRVEFSARRIVMYLPHSIAESGMNCGRASVRTRTGAARISFPYSANSLRVEGSRNSPEFSECIAGLATRGARA